ncbi:MAG: class I SAM-dependent methyltransferase [Vicinamibacterales bacterium]
MDSAALDRLLAADLDPANRRRLRVALEWLNPKRTDRVLDCGCGLGWSLVVMGAACPCRLVGIDVDPRRLAHAAEVCGRTTPLAAASAAALPFPDGSFDAVLITEVLEHIEDDRRALREVVRIVKPGGLVAITVPNVRYPFWWDPVNRIREWLGLSPVRQGFFGGIWTDHVRLYSRDDITTLAADAGLAVDDVRMIPGIGLPFAHNLLYGLGKWLVLNGVLVRASRFSHRQQPATRMHPLRWPFLLVAALDRLNDRRRDDEEPSVSIAVAARKPR